MSQDIEIDVIDRSIPYSSIVIIVVGIIILLSGAFFVYVPPTQPLSAGLGVFALGLALISFGLTQRNSYNNRLTTYENNKRLIRIEEKLDELGKKP
ncbi:hypothetical protein [uncultured Methanoregula sp.]|uniref:hypothetical protein n=1 Tax=uncultured Methanoregula sp. TaxID=1005933 RepID=UPI002AAB32E4|nr:hypothetical protein [uncultured Methanoregula sp.]